MTDAAVWYGLYQDYEQNLATIASGTGGNPDIFSPALDKQIAAGYEALLPAVSPAELDVAQAEAAAEAEPGQWLASLAWTMS